jgi:hypothetical protein
VRTTASPVAIAAAALLASVALLTTTPAGANPRPLPFTYTADTLPAGEGEVEQYVDLAPVKALDPNGNPVWYGATQLQTEFEYGITDRLELGLYVTLAPTPPGYSNTAVLPEGNGIKQRLRWRPADEDALPLDVALYGELVENDFEFEIEAKIILQKRLGRLRIAANLWGEREFYYAANQQDWVANPTLGATYEITPMWHLGVEGWMRGEWPDSAPHPRPFNLGPHEYVGPALMIDFGKLWWSTGVYVRVDDLDRSLLPADAYGPVWARTIIGLEL